MVEAILVDNPLIVKHLRSRMRQRDLLAPMSVALILALFALWAGGSDRGDPSLSFVLMLQGAILFLGGTAQVASSVAQARDSGMLDFHRISPQSPLSMAIGFLLGGPVREWSIAACLVPVELLILPHSHLSAPALALILGSMVVCGLLYHLVGLVVGLVTPRPRVASSVALGVALLYFACMAGPISYLTVVPAVVLAAKWSAFSLGTTMFTASAEQHFVMALLHQVVFLALFLLAAVREIRQERAYFLSKPGVIGFFAIGAGLFAVDLQTFSVPPLEAAWTYLYGLIVLAMVMVIGVTPDARDFAKGVRRAMRAGLGRGSLASDTAPNWLPLVGTGALAAVACLTLAQRHPWTGANGMEGYVRALVIGLSALVAFASARQGFELRFRGRHSRSYFMLLVFVDWVVPLLLAAVIGQQAAQSDLPSLVLGLCPWVGMGIAATPSSMAPVLVGIHVFLAGWAVAWRLRIEAQSTEAARNRA
jgi:hypothetical protein